MPSIALDAPYALVIIDLQFGVLGLDLSPFGRDHVVSHCLALGRAFAAVEAPIFLTTTNYAPAYADRPRGKTDAAWRLAEGGLPPDFSKLVPETAELPVAGHIVKSQMNAFYGSNLDLQLRRRGCRTVVICGVATNMGVEGTALAAHELNYDVVIAADACASVSAGWHEFAVENILPRIARVRTTVEIVEAVGKR